MTKKRLIADILSVVLAIGLFPSLAIAAGGGADIQVAASQLGAQAESDLGGASVRFTDEAHKGGDGDFWQLYFVEGKKAVAEPMFDVYLGGTKVPPSAYTVTYYLTYWKGDSEVSEKVSASELYPSRSSEADDADMSSAFRYVVEAKDGSGYTGKLESEIAEINVVDLYSFGRYMGVFMTKADSSWQYAINPMNHNYFVIPQAKAKAALGSLEVLAGCTPGNGGANPDGVKVPSKYYTVSYYKARKDAVEKNMSPASSAKTGKALRAVPTAAGSYVAIVKGKSPYYGSSSFYFDIQGKLSDVKVSGIADQVENGKYIEPGVTMTYKGEKLVEGTDYDVAYQANLKAGTAKAVITGARGLANTDGIVDSVDKARYFTGTKVVKFKIRKHPSKTWAANTMQTSAKAVEVSGAKLRNKGDQSVAASKAFSVKGAAGKVAYSKVSGPSVLSISRSGKVTISQHLGMLRQWSSKDQVYSMKVKVMAKGDSTHYALAKTLILKVKVTK